jgi:hypothetical protein
LSAHHCTSSFDLLFALKQTASRLKTVEAFVRMRKIMQTLARPHLVADAPRFTATFPLNYGLHRMDGASENP